MKCAHCGHRYDQDRGLILHAEGCAGVDQDVNANMDTAEWVSGLDS